MGLNGSGVAFLKKGKIPLDVDGVGFRYTSLLPAWSFDSLYFVIYLPSSIGWIYIHDLKCRCLNKGGVPMCGWRGKYFLTFNL